MFKSLNPEGGVELSHPGPELLIVPDEKRSSNDGLMGGLAGIRLALIC
jgi:hypothetical protein